MRRTLHRIALLAVVVALAAPPAAFGQGAFGPLPQATTAAPPTTASSSSTVDNGGLRTWQEILIFLGGVGLIAGIAWAILSDARKAAPMTEAEYAGHGAGAGGRKAQTKAKGRKRAKAAKAARRRNR